MHPRVLMALLVACAFAFAGVLAVALGDGDESDSAELGDEFEGSLIPEGFDAPDFILTDEEGQPVGLRQYAGQPVIVTFVYATCEDSCPGQAQVIRGALDELGHDVPAIAISVDPGSDTPERAQAFLRRQRVTGRIRFALGSRAELEPVWRGFAIQAQERDSEHQARIVLIDAQGRQRVGFPFAQATAERIAHDLRLLEAGV